jgi:hypothetical protein
MVMCFILKSVVKVERYIIVEFMLSDRLLMSFKLTAIRS